MSSRQSAQVNSNIYYGSVNLPSMLSFRRTLCSTDIPFCLLHLQNNLLNETWEIIVFDRHKLCLYQSSLSIKDWLTKILYGIRPNNYYVVYVSVDLPSVLRCCWLGGRKGFWPVKNWVVGCWHGYLSGARCRLAMAQRIPLLLTVSWFHCYSLSLASVKSRLVLPFWYRLTRVVPEKGPLNLFVYMCLCRVLLCLTVLSPVLTALVSSSKYSLTAITRYYY